MKHLVQKSNFLKVKGIRFARIINNTVMILSFRTDIPGQIVQTQIRLIRVYTVCHSVCIVWTHYSVVEPHSSNFRMITTNFLGVRIFRKFTVVLIYCERCILHKSDAAPIWIHRVCHALLLERENLSSVFATRLDSNRPVQPTRLARLLKFWL